MIEKGFIFNQMMTILCVFRHGQSNPTFLISTDAGQEYVLRKQPTGELLYGAHRVCQIIDCQFTLCIGVGMIQKLGGLNIKKQT